MRVSEDELSHIEQSAKGLIAWRTNLMQSIQKYRDWLDSSKALSVEQSLKFQELEQNLATNTLVVAFVGEFSRGKSELINALFFRDANSARLPSGLGRTTMCPTEIFYDASLSPALWLLPLSTRSGPESIREAKTHLIDWTKVNLAASQSIQTSFSLLSKTEQIPRLEAQYLGLMPPPSYIDAETNLDSTVEVPAWRYAMLNLPNPLLISGIRIIDTPGLNAVGCEPELTLSLLPSAHAVVFILDADTGVTKTDLETWERLIPGSAACRIVVINKIDLVRSAVKSAAQVENELAALKKSTSQLLGVNEEHIFMVSAKWAVEAAALSDVELFKQSGVSALEQFVASNLIPSQQQLLAKSISSSLMHMVECSVNQLKERSLSLTQLCADLHNFKKTGHEAAMEVWKGLATSRDKFQLHQSRFREKRAEARAIHQRLLLNLVDKRLDQICERASGQMESAWTTRGLVSSMTQLMGDILELFESTDRDTTNLERLVSGLYEEFSSTFGYKVPIVPKLGLVRWKEELRRIQSAAHAFAANPSNIVLLEKSFMIRKFWDLVLARSRDVFLSARAETERWLVNALLPIEIQLSDQKKQLVKTAEILDKLREKSATVDGEILRQSKQIAAIKKELGSLEELMLLMSPRDRALYNLM